MADPTDRDDISQFVVHLTRRYKGKSPRDNLVSILADRVIEARTAHCLFAPLFNSLQFTPLLKGRFKTVCLTETPLNQIDHLCAQIPGRKIKLQPYGLVFYKSTVLRRGGSPAIYINAQGTQIKNYLLKQFREHFKGIRSLHRFAIGQQKYHKQMIQYYSLINIIASHYNFAWEREWRYSGNFKFKYFDIVAIIARNPDNFTKYCQQSITGPRIHSLRKIPVISPKWSYEQIVDEMSCQIWNALS